LDEEIRYVRARDEPPCPAARIDQRAIGIRLRPIGQDHGTHDDPVEFAPADDAFLHVLVVRRAPAADETPRYKGFTVSRPIPLLAPIIRTVATASYSQTQLAHRSCAM